MTTFPKSPRFKTHSSPSPSKRKSSSSRRRREIKSRTVNPVPKSPGVPPPSRIPVLKLAMRDTRFPIVVSKKADTTTSNVPIKAGTRSHDSEMEPPTVADLRNPRDSNGMGESERNVRASQIKEILVLIEMNKNCLERIQEMIQAL